MKNNYQDILERISLIEKVTPKLKQTTNDEKIQNIKKELNIYKLLIEEALERKQKNQTVIIEENPEIKKIEAQINILIKFKKIELTENNFFEGLGINKILYRLDNAEILEDYNKNIIEIVELLDTVSIKLTENDFNLTKDVNKYMKAFFRQINKKNFDLDMKNVFDGIYWENNDLLEEITLNMKKTLKSIEPRIKEFMAKTKKGYIQKYKINTENIDQQLLSLLKQEKKLKETDKYLIDSKIKNKTINIHNFIGENKRINNAINEFVNQGTYREMSIEQRNNFEDNVSTLYFNIQEYQMYQKYSYLVDEVKEVLNKQIQKGIYEKQLKNYEKINKQKETKSLMLDKLEKEKNKLLAKKTLTANGENARLEKITSIDKKLKNTKNEIKEIIKDIKKEQKNISYLQFEEKIKSTINMDSSIFDILKIYSENHLQLIKTMKKHEDKSIKELESKILQFKKLVSNPIVNELKNITINDSDNYEKKIKDQAANFNLTLDFNDAESIEKILNNAHLIYEFKNLKRSRINLTELKKYL